MLEAGVEHVLNHLHRPNPGRGDLLIKDAEPAFALDPPRVPVRCDQGSELDLGAHADGAVTLQPEIFDGACGVVGDGEEELFLPPAIRIPCAHAEGAELIRALYPSRRADSWIGQGAEAGLTTKGSRLKLMSR